MIKTRIPPLTKTLVLISDRLDSLIVLRILANCTHMMSHNPLYTEKKSMNQVTKNILEEKVGVMAIGGVKSKETRSYQKRNVIVLYLAHFKGMCCFCAKYRTITFRF